MLGWEAEMRRFTVLTLNWNGRSVLPGMIASVAGSVERLGGDLVVFDNCSTDGSDTDAQREWGDRSWFRLVRSPVNLGFAGGVNTAVRDIGSNIIVLANSDTEFLPGSLETLVEFVENHHCYGITCPRLLWPDGTLQRSLRDFPFPGALLREHLPLLKKRSAINDPHTRPRTADWLVGAVMVFRRELFMDAGGFDRDFFFYHEETELQYRLKGMGYPSFFLPEAVVVHLEGASARQKFGNTSYTKYIHAKIKFLGKHGYRGSETLFRAFMGLLQVCRLAAGLLRPGLRRRDIRFTSSYCGEALRELCRRNGQERR
jgi:GT2 family glycosyltransferase